MASHTDHFTTINPYTLQTIEVHPKDRLNDVENKIKLSHAAFECWKKTSFIKREELFKNLAWQLRQQKKIIAELITQEMGKPMTESLAEVEKCALTCEYYAGFCAQAMDTKTVNSEFTKSYIVYQPIGIILGIMPWNFPLWQVIRFAIPTLSAGNVVLLKHAPNVLGCAKLVEKLFTDAGFEKGIYQNLVIETDLVQNLLSDFRIKGVSLTGSEKAGKAVAAIAGANIKKSVLELGSNDPFIVLKDADLKAAAEVALQSRMQNAGQVCISAKRIIVEQSVKEEFLHQIKEQIDNWRPADPMQPETKMGPLARMDLADNIEIQYKEAIKNGAHAISPFGRDRCMVQPVILDNIHPDSIAFNEETFGPLAAIISAGNAEEALDLANQSRFGLGATVFTRDLDKAEVLALRLNAGTVYINGLVKTDPRFPVGGINNSGYGRELSDMGPKEFCNIKTIIIP